MKKLLLSVIIPCYNEKNTILKIIDKINKLKKIKKEIILIDDFSNDGTRELLKKKFFRNVKKIIFHKKNKGKGAAIRSAQKYVNGEIVIIQDGDLEYDPKDYYKIILPIIKKKFLVVYGSRILGRRRYQLKNFTSIIRVFGNQILTFMSNYINNQNLTDAHTCYKAFNSKIFKMIKLEENGFSFCPEVTTKLSNMNIKIIEVPISYNGRTIEEGKKIQTLDAFKALLTLLKYKLLNRH